MDVSQFIFALQIIGVCLGVVCITLAIIVYSHYYINVKEWTLIEIYSELSIILFGISSTCSSFYFMSHSCTSIPKSTYCTVINAIWTFSWRFGCLSLYLLFTKRLQFTFDNTSIIYKTSNIIYYIIYILCILFIASSMAQFIEYVLYFDYHESHNQYNMVEIIGTIITVIIDLLLSIGLIGLYIRKLWQLNNQVANPFPLRHEINSAQTMILNAIGKITILSTLAIISSQLLLIFQTVMYFQNISVANEVTFLIWFMLNDLDCIINVFCIFLSFDFNEDLYHKICGNLHICCYKICRIVYSKTHKRNALELNLLDGNDAEM